MKKLHAKPKNLNLIPGTYMVEREKQLPNAAFLTPNVNTPPLPTLSEEIVIYLYHTYESRFYITQLPLKFLF